MRQGLVANPALADTFFWHRFEHFLGMFVVKVWGATDFWFRVEYQSRGSPHVHGTVWMPDGPDLMSRRTTRQEVLEFADRYVSTINTGWEHGQATAPSFTDAGPHPSSLRPQDICDDELDLATSLNFFMRHTRCTHCRKIRKGRTVCRMGFPKELAMEGTVVFRKAPGHWNIETQRNDERIGSYNPQLLLIWRGNCDVQPVRSGTDMTR